MRVFLTGGTGSIGRRIVRSLLDRGDQAVILTRDVAKARSRPEVSGAEFIAGDPSSAGNWQDAVEGCDAVVNLVGENVFGGRWNPELKRKIRDSRVYGTEHVVSAISKATNRPKVLVQASAVGYYGSRGDDELSEDAPSGADFLAVICREWEGAARPALDLGVRLVPIRVGIVLNRGEGALRVMEPIFKWLPGGAAPVGGSSGAIAPASGDQWMSWIHIDDIVGLFLLALDRPEASGPINGTAPNPARNKELSRALARVLHRPFLPIGPPAALLRILLGEVAEVIQTGQRAVPSRALALGYEYKFPDLNAALADLFGRSQSAKKSGESAVEEVHRA